MKLLDRRGLLWPGAWLGLVPFIQAQANDKLSYGQFKKETPMAALKHCDFVSVDRFSLMLTNMSNHLWVYANDPFKPKLVMAAQG